MSKIVNFLIEVTAIAIIFAGLTFSFFLGGSIYSGRPMPQLIADAQHRVFGEKERIPDIDLSDVAPDKTPIVPSTDAPLDEDPPSLTPKQGER